MPTLQKIQKLPGPHKKFILLGILAIIAVPMVLFLIKDFKGNLAKMQGKRIMKTPDFSGVTKQNNRLKDNLKEMEGVLTTSTLGTTTSGTSTPTSSAGSIGQAE